MYDSKLSTYMRLMCSCLIALPIVFGPLASHAQSALPRANKKPLTEQQQTCLTGRDIRAVDTENAPMWVSIAGDILAAPYGNDWLPRLKERIAKHSGVINPSSMIEIEIIETLSKRYSMTIGTTLPNPSGRRAPADPAITVNSIAFLWGIEYFPLSWQRFRGTYLAEIVVTSSGPNGWAKKTDCSNTFPRTAAEGGSLDQMVANRSRRLNEALLISARQCRDTMLGIFGLSSQDVPSEIVAKHNRIIENGEIEDQMKSTTPP